MFSPSSNVFIVTSSLICIVTLFADSSCQPASVCIPHSTTILVSRPDQLYLSPTHINTKELAHCPDVTISFVIDVVVGWRLRSMILAVYVYNYALMQPMQCAVQESRSALDCSSCKGDNVSRCYNFTKVLVIFEAEVKLFDLYVIKSL